MNQVIAKVKGKALKSFFKLISKATLFETITIDPANCIPYNPDHNLDEDSWFKIENFSQKDFCIDLLKSDFDSKNYDDLTKEQFHKIAYIFCVQDDNFYFQKITPALFLQRKMIVFGEVAKIENNNNRLVINEIPDAVYLKNCDTLIFRNLAPISYIFKGIDVLYREASRQDVEDFLASSFIDLSGNYGVDFVSTPNRKRISLVLDTLSKLSDKDKKDLPNYINEYCKERLKYNSKELKFKISTDDELKYLLYGIEQRFYTTPFSKEKRLANSIISI
jgi:hypothetical protein